MRLLSTIETAVSTAIFGSLLAILDQAWNRVLKFLQAFYTWIGNSQLREFSRMFQKALQHPGVQVLNDHLVGIVVVVSAVVGAMAAIVLWRMLWSGMRMEKTAFNTIEKKALRMAGSPRQIIVGYLKALLTRFLEGVILFWGVLAVTTAVFIICKTMWFSYMASPVGRLYPIYFPQRAKLMSMVLGQDMFNFPLMTTTIAFGMGMLVAAVCRFFYLTRYIFLARGVVGKILLVALPLNLLTAAVIRPIFSQPHWGAAYAATIIPTLLGFHFCFQFTNRFLPEMGMLFRGLSRKGKAPAHVTFLRNLNSNKTVLEFDPVSGRRTGRRFPASDGVHTHGQFLSRRGREFIVYRYGRDLFFQVDRLELRLHPHMSARLLEKGRFSRRFELFRDDTHLFRLGWSTLPMPGHLGAATLFFRALEEILQNRDAYESAFIIEDDPPDTGDDFAGSFNP